MKFPTNKQLITGVCSHKGIIYNLEINYFLTL